ncbi:hypothetical protein AB4099_27510 [Bosea sp. 2KB_26]|uniref:hypothetical protein n=1 Tax=Bosea sp. 2KB_26 TaxID=3237475 RepID=UPI003F92F792
MNPSIQLINQLDEPYDQTKIKRTKWFISCELRDNLRQEAPPSDRAARATKAIAEAYGGSVVASGEAFPDFEFWDHPLEDVSLPTGYAVAGTEGVSDRAAGHGGLNAPVARAGLSQLAVIAKQSSRRGALQRCSLR